MICFRLLFLSVFLIIPSKGTYFDDYKVFCFYDSKGFYRQGSAKVTLPDIEPALPYCTHLLYGHAAISSLNYKLVPMNRDLETDGVHSYYSKIVNFKKSYPNIKVLLSVGGGMDLDGPEKYLKLLETAEARTNFIDSAFEVLKQYGFDGINLAWQFPPNKGKKPRKTIGSIWHKIKKTVKGEKLVDKNHVMHKSQFTQMVHSMHTKFSEHSLMITASVLPNVKSSMFFDFHSLLSDLEYVILHAYDFYTPHRNDKEADYAIPLRQVGDRYSELNINAVVTEWTSHFFTSSRIILAVPTFGRAWTVKADSTSNGQPPLSANGPALEGQIINEKGLRSYPEICNSFVIGQEMDGRYLFNHNDDPNCGPYAYRMTLHSGSYGEWISYEDPEDISYKMSYVKDKQLGGVALVDLTLDDVNGVCTDRKFPLLRTAASNLNSRLYDVHI